MYICGILCSEIIRNKYDIWQTCFYYHKLIDTIDFRFYIGHSGHHHCGYHDTN